MTLGLVAPHASAGRAWARSLTSSSFYKLFTEDYAGCNPNEPISLLMVIEIQWATLFAASAAKKEEIVTQRDVSERATYEQPAATVAREVESVLVDPFALRRTAVDKANEAISLAFGVGEALIAIRVVLRLLSANAQADFAEWIYAVTRPFVTPFGGVFANPSLNGGVLEIESLIALGVYALAAWVLTALISILFGEARRGLRRSSRRVETSVR